jgi:hypothetical protein
MTQKNLFATLDWRPHPMSLTGERAILHFPNGYAASVLRGGTAYTAGGTYEIAVMSHGQLDYTTPITGDVLGYLSEAEANEILAQIAALPESAP